MGHRQNAGRAGGRYTRPRRGFRTRSHYRERHREQIPITMDVIKRLRIQVKRTRR